MKILETGDIAYYPDIFNPSGKPMEIIGRRKLRYPNGKRFYQYFIKGHTDDKTGLTDRLVENMKENVANDYDNLVIICGAEGVGKSNMAVDLCKSYDPTFTVEHGDGQFGTVGHINFRGLLIRIATILEFQFVHVRSILSIL